MGDGRRRNQHPSPPGAAVLLAGAACCLGSAHAGVSAYWALGGTALLDTVGGTIERWAREGGADVTLALWSIVAAKVLASSVGLVAVVAHDHPRIVRAPVARRRRHWVHRRTPLGWARAGAGVVAVVLVVYGGVLTVVGLAVQAGIVEVGAGADRRALAWHAYLWDPWFLVWGATLGSALWISRSRVHRLH